jgi:hypothetical protein
VLNAGIVWNVVAQRELLALLGLPVVLAWPLGRMLANIGLFLSSCPARIGSARENR